MRTRAVRRVLLPLLALSIAAAVPGVAGASFPGQNGAIAFVHDDDIWTVNPDGSGLRRVTTDPRTDRSPAWSPDGTTLTFARGLRGGSFGTSDIWTIRADGTGRRRVTSAPGKELMPSWDPTGTRIVYVSDFNRLRTVRADGSRDRLLYSVPPGSEFTMLLDPDWGPGGVRIAFSSVPPAQTGGTSTVRSDGTGVRTIYQPPFGGLGDHTEGNSWAPNGARIAFTEVRPSLEDRFQSRIASMSPLGADLQYLTDGAKFDRAPSWSPDGSRIAFVSNSPNGLGIYTMNSDGTDRRLVFDNGREEPEPAWQPLR